MPKNKRGFYSLIGLTLGVFIMAVGILNFLEPYNLAPGGVTGLSVALKTLIGIPLYMTNLIINIPLFILGLLVLGKKFGWRTFYATVMLSFFLRFIQFRIPTPNLVISSIVGGLCLGIGIGTVLSAGGTTGGTDLIAALIRKYNQDIKIGNIMMVVDGFVIVFAVIVEKNITVAIFSILSMLILTRTIDFILINNIYGEFF